MIEGFIACSSSDSISVFDHDFVTCFSEIVSGNRKLIYHGTPLTYKDALDHCKRQNASLALVDSKPVQLALESLLISKNSGKAQPWKELVWTSVLTSVGNKCSTAPRLMDFRSLSKYTKDHKTYLNAKTQWLAVGSNEKHNFVCQKGWLTCIARFNMLCFYLQRIA